MKRCTPNLVGYTFHSSALTACFVCLRLSFDTIPLLLPVTFIPALVMLAALISGFLLKLAMIVTVSVTFAGPLSSSSVLWNLAADCTLVDGAQPLPLFGPVLHYLWPPILLVAPLVMMLVLRPCRNANGGVGLIDVLLLSFVFLRLQSGCSLCRCVVPCPQVLSSKSTSQMKW